MLLCIMLYEIVKCQACQEGCVIDHGTNAPLLVEVDIVLIDLSLLGAIENGENMWLDRLVKQRQQIGHKSQA